MATFDQVKTVRLRIHDPLGFINLVEAEELPATPANQTAYTIPIRAFIRNTVMKSGLMYRLKYPTNR